MKFFNFISIVWGKWLFECFVIGIIKCYNWLRLRLLDVIWIGVNLFNLYDFFIIRLGLVIFCIR